MQDEAVYERVEAYVLGTMAAADRVEFERELSTDEDLRHEVLTSRRLIHGIAEAGVRERIAAAGQRYRTAAPADRPALDAGVRTSGARVVSFRRWGAVAAGVAAVLLIGLWALFPLPGGGGSDFFEPAVGLPTTLGVAEDLQFQDGMVSYKLGEYREALGRWSPLLALDPGNDTLLFYSGVSLMALDSNDRADATLRAIDEDYLAGRDYYLALLRHRAGDTEDARTLLRGVAETESVYAGRALDVITRLEDR